jgi:sporulation protein YlmC with PRC-barrel domain
MNSPDESMTLISAGKVQGTPVYSEHAEELGEIYDVMLEKRTGRIAYAVLAFGGMLGLGKKYVPLPWELLSFDLIATPLGLRCLPCGYQSYDGPQLLSREARSKFRPLRRRRHWSSLGHAPAFAVSGALDIECDDGNGEPRHIEHQPTELACRPDAMAGFPDFVSAIGIWRLRGRAR